MVIYRPKHVLLGAAIVILCATVVCRAQNAEWQRYDQIGKDDFISYIITALGVDNEGRSWVGTDRGLVWTHDAGRTWDTVNLIFAVPRNTRRPLYLEAPPSGRELAGTPALRRNTITCIRPGRMGIWIGTLNGLCYGKEDLRDWETFPAADDVPGPEIYAVEEYPGEVWVSATNGIFKSGNAGARWEKINGVFPNRISSITVEQIGDKRYCWLAGFNSQPEYGGGQDIIRSMDGGLTWEPIASGVASRVSRVLSSRVNSVRLIGNTLWAAGSHGLAYSGDAGEDWHLVRPQSGLDVAEIYDILDQGGRLWACTAEGIYTSTDKGVTWIHVGYLRSSITSMAPDGESLWLGSNSGLIRRIRGGEMRSFSVKTNVLSIARRQQFDSHTWWIGTTGGLLSSDDYGQNWILTSVADGLPGNRVLSLANKGERIWVGTDGGVWTTSEGGGTRAYRHEHGLHGLRINDLKISGESVWAATDAGLSLLPPGKQEWRTFQPGRQWYAIWIDGKTIYGAVSSLPPEHGTEVIKGTIEDEKWETLNVPGHYGTAIHQLLGIGTDLWMASDSGLFRTRDGGVTWARFGGETLWSSRVTAICTLSPTTLCAQAIPNDPPSSTAYLSVTRDGGKTWSVLLDAVPGHAQALSGDEESIIAGMSEVSFGGNVFRGGLAQFRELDKNLKPPRTNWHMFERIAGLAASTYRADAYGSVSVIDNSAIHEPTIWFGSNGAGALERGLAPLDPIFPAWSITGSLPLDVRPYSTLPDRQMLTMADSPEGLWIGTADGLYFRDRIGEITVYHPAPNGLIAAPVRSLAVAGPNVWVGTDYGLNLLHRPESRWESFVVTESPLPDNRVNALAFDGDNLWGGTPAGGFKINPDGTWQNVLEEERIHDIAVGYDREYFATERGVFVRDRQGESRRHLQVRNSPLPDDNVMKVFINGPELWAVTEKGVTKILYDKTEPELRLDIEPSVRGPAGVLLVVNENDPDSVKIANAYAALRAIPDANICRIRCPSDEAIIRSAFEEQIRRPILRYILAQNLARSLSFIVTTRGIPLRIVPDAAQQTAGVKPVSLDSELTLIGLRYAGGLSVPNPYLHRDERFDSTKMAFYLVTRLDGPDPYCVIGGMRNALFVEEDHAFGSRGFARFDTFPGEDPIYARINSEIWNCYQTMREQDKYAGRVDLPEKTSLPLFREGSAINTFFFAGLKEEEYKPDVFSWVQGAVAVPLDFVSASTMHDDTKSWLAGAVKAGLAAGIGTTGEPEPGGIVSVAELFEYLKNGYTWGEAAYMCIPHLSGQTVVIGDPLYTPFK